MAKIKISSNLFDRLKDAAEAQGYSSPDEFVNHIIEQELAKCEGAEEDEKIAERLKGLGYLE